MGSSSSAFPGKDFSLRIETSVASTFVYYSVYIDRTGTQSQTWSNAANSSWEVLINGLSNAKSTGLNYDFQGSASSFLLYSGGFSNGPANVLVEVSATYDQLGSTSNSHTVSIVTVPTAPTPNAGTPSNITSSSMRYQFTAGNNGNSGFLEHQTQRATNSAFTSGIQTVSSNGTYDFTGLSAVTDYFFRTRSRNSVGWGPWSATRSAKTLANAPSTPNSPTASNVLPSQMTLSWSLPSNGGAALDQMKLRRSGTSTFATFVDYDLGGSVKTYTATGLSPNTTYYWRLYARNSIGTSSPSATLTMATTPASPAAPSVVTVARVSDTAHTISWTRNATTGAPYVSQQVQRLTNVANSTWVGVANFGAETTTASQSWTDNGTTANRAYQYRVKATNTTGEATSGATAWAYTTPGAPSSLGAVKQANGDVVLTVAQTVSHTDYQTKLQSKVGTGAWTTLTTLASGVNTYTWTPPAGSSVQFQAQVVVNAAAMIGNNLASAWVASNVVPLQSAPNPPSALSPNGLSFDAMSTQTFLWKHNTVDSSAQTAYEIQYRIGAAAWTSTGKITSTSMQRLFAAQFFSNGNVYQWQVRTWGAFTNPSDWSPAATFTASASPSVSITSPGTVLEASRVVVAWNYTDPEGTAQSMWAAELLFQGTVLEHLSSSGSAASADFTARLTDATNYQVRVQVRDGSSLWSQWDQVSFTTNFPLPPQPVLDSYWESTSGSVSLSVTNPDGGTTVVDYNQILRSLDGGTTWEHVLDTLPNNTGFDTGVPLGVAEVRYKAVAWTALPSSSESILQFIDTTSSRGYWSAGPSFEQVIQLRVNIGSAPKIDLTTGLTQKTLHYFAGRRSPVEMTGEATERSGSVEFAVTSAADVFKVRSMALLVAPHLFRLPDGTLIYSSVGSVSDTRLAEGWYHITFDITEVDR